jgi:hypothetical protein
MVSSLPGNPTNHLRSRGLRCSTPNIVPRPDRRFGSHDEFYARNLNEFRHPSCTRIERDVDPTPTVIPRFAAGRREKLSPPGHTTAEFAPTQVRR